jgi:hypothetical protein
MREAPLVIASDAPDTRTLARALDGEWLAVPADAGVLEEWRARELGRGASPRIVVACLAPDAFSPRDAAQLDTDKWLACVEDATARWVFALGVAAARCADGGAIVAVVDRPAPLDCGGFAAEAAVAEAACALVRSLARSEGERGVRVNAVATSARLAPPHPVAPPPALASFPGAIEREVAGAVRLLLAEDARGVTGQVIPADCGRTW